MLQLSAGLSTAPLLPLPPIFARSHRFGLAPSPPNVGRLFWSLWRARASNWALRKHRCPEGSLTGSGPGLAWLDLASALGGFSWFRAVICHTRLGESSAGSNINDMRVAEMGRYHLGEKGETNKLGHFRRVGTVLSGCDTVQHRSAIQHTCG
jgi:hypothetical protein